jgi:signal transduction histidine kinase
VDYIEYALKDQQLNSARTQSKYQMLFLFLAVLLCIMTFIIIIILWRSRKRSQKIAQALRVQFEQSESTMEALEVMNKDYARVIKIVAHDLRNPIGAINAITAMLQPDETLTAETRELIDLVQVSSKNCLELINELLETDLDQQQNLKKEKVNLNELLEQCTRLLSFMAQDKDQEVILNSNAPDVIHADYEKLWRVMNNLIINAIKFSPAGSEIHIDAGQLNNEVVIAVTDTGMGIPANLQNKIFDPFTSARRQGTHNEQPIGLGLYISKQIIEAHHGKIWFESDAGKGTVFYISLPMDK